MFFQYVVTSTCGKFTCEGRGSNKKEAKQAAAKEMLKKINKERQIIQGLDESEETEEENVDSKEKNVLKESESYVVARFFLLNQNSPVLFLF